jgi:hypothetical protein
MSAVLKVVVWSTPAPTALPAVAASVSISAILAVPAAVRFGATAWVPVVVVVVGGVVPACSYAVVSSLGVVVVRFLIVILAECMPCYVFQTVFVFAIRAA